MIFWAPKSLGYSTFPALLATVHRTHLRGSGLLHSTPYLALGGCPMILTFLIPWTHLLQLKLYLNQWLPDPSAGTQILPHIAKSQLFCKNSSTFQFSCFQRQYYVGDRTLLCSVAGLNHYWATSSVWWLKGNASMKLLSQWCWTFTNHS